ncbi:hypothetical protein L9G74_16125 [Shewanella sp. C32]|uniref:Uncharacterized protein n=1 Tax=Shewanella electrica TaxID=515560 RepID=A0ABT2FPS8_9GAMM|nr:hypothetical protein [Shewanella electrica]MCH1926516.1 hypothetical protein [Shewanella electrica]MCS4557972.1 hypothetical protein [Shewanella electrica]
MLTRPLYELLPYAYMTLGAVSFMKLEPDYALLSSIVLFVLGARIYALRSQNRRTDPEIRRKSGNMPKLVYDLLPFLYVLSALAIFKYLPEKIFPLLAICLLTYGFYVMFRRSMYRRHRLPVSSSMF